MGDDITIGVTEIVNNIEVTAQPSDQVIEIDVVDNSDDVTLNITPTVIEININKGSSFARWGTILGNLPDQEDLQNVLNLKADLVGGLVPASQLPSYVDDIIEVANYAALPVVGETGKIYLTLDTNKIFRWSGSVYIEIASDSGYVHIAGAETITGLKTFTETAKFDLNINLSKTGFFNVPSLYNTIGAYNTEFKFGIDSSRIAIVDLASLTAPRIYNYPDKDGVFAMTSDLHSALTIGTANGLSLSGQELSLGLSSASTNGALSSTDWSRFNSAVPAGTPTTGDFVYYNGSNLAYKALLASAPLSFNSGTGTFSISQSNTSTNGFLSSTDWNSFNSKISGSGTTNYLPKFTGASTIGDSVIFDDGTQIGIGTNVPQRKLSVRDINNTYGATFSGSAGLNMVAIGTVSGATNGVPSIAAFTNSFAATTNLAINPTGGNVGINTTSPLAKMTVRGGNLGNSVSMASTIFSSQGNDQGIFMGSFNGTPGYGSWIQVGREAFDLQFNLSLQPNGGNVGINTTSPTTLLQVKGNGNNMISLQYTSDGGAAGYGFYNSAGTELWSIGGGRFVAQDALEFSRQGSLKMIINSSGNVELKNSDSRLYGGDNVGRFIIGNPSVTTYLAMYGSSHATVPHLAQFVVNNLPVLNMTSSGRVFINTTSGVGQEQFCVNFDSNSGLSQAINIKDTYASASGAFYVVFRKNDDAGIGSISRIGTTSAVAYNTTSDYRLKEDLKEIKGLEKISKIKVYDFKWKDDNSRMDGVIAHELQEVVPYAVTGEKDAKEMQQVDYSKLVPILVQAIQELNDKIKILENDKF